MHQKLKLPQKLNWQFIKKNADCINWDEVSLLVKIEDLPYDFIEDFAEEWNWDIIASSHSLSEIFLLRFEKYLNPRTVLAHQVFYERYFTRVITRLSNAEVFYYRIIPTTNSYSEFNISTSRSYWISQIKLKKPKNSILQWLKEKLSLLKISFR